MASFDGARLRAARKRRRLSRQRLGEALGRDGRMLRALDQMGPGNMMVEGRPFRVDLD